jgi:hypothetical protein
MEKCLVECYHGEEVYLGDSIRFYSPQGHLPGTEKATRPAVLQLSRSKSMGLLFPPDDAPIFRDNFSENSADVLLPAERIAQRRIMITNRIALPWLRPTIVDFRTTDGSHQQKVTLNCILRSVLQKTSEVAGRLDFPIAPLAITVFRDYMTFLFEAAARLRRTVPGINFAEIIPNCSEETISTAMVEAAKGQFVQ